MVSIIEILISLIVVSSALIYIEIIFRKSDPEDIDINKELKERWIGSLDNFIEFKKFQYGRAFSLISEVTPFVIFSLTLLLVAFKDQIIEVTGLTIYVSFILSIMLILLKLIIVLGEANKKANNNMKILLNRPNSL